MSRADDLCTAMGIRIEAPRHARANRQPRRTFARKTIGRLLERHGEGHAALVLKTIAETRNNATELYAETILAVSDVMLAHPEWPARNGWLDLFDQIELADLRRRAGALAVGTRRQGIRVLLADHLDRQFCPPEPRLI